MAANYSDHLHAGGGQSPYGDGMQSPYGSTTDAPFRGGNQPSPYGSGDPYYNESSGFITPHPAKKGTSPWLKIGVPVLILAIIGGVVGAVVATRKHSSAASSGASAAASAQKALGVYATSTNSDFMMPVYPSTVST